MSQFVWFSPGGISPYLCRTAQNVIQKNSRTWHMAMEKIRLRLKFVPSQIRVRPNARIRNFSILLRAQFSLDYFNISDNDRSFHQLYTSKAINFILQIGLAFKFHYLDFNRIAVQ